MRDPFRLLGTAIENRYRIDTVIGEGGFGVVYRGHHLRLEHPVAIKCLKIPSHFTPEAKEIFLKRFREEGKILLKLADAAGVPRIYDYATHIGEREIPYLVIEWLDGQTLEEMLASRRAAKLTGLAGADAIALMLPAVEALAIAHRNQIAHRDIKPANLFLASGPRGPIVKVLDFGIAKAMQEGEFVTQSQTQTATSFRAFTPNYAAPEQFAPKRHGASGPWTDVHALGLLLVELLTDRIANGGDDFVDCLESAMSEQRPSARDRGATISDELEAVVQKAVARAPDARYRDASALAAALRDVPEAKAGPSSAFATLAPMPRTDPQPPLREPVKEIEPAPPPRTEIANELLEKPALTQPAVSPTRPDRKPPPKPNKRSPLPIVLGALLVSAGAIGAIVVATRDHVETEAGDAPIAVPSGSGATAVARDQAPTIQWAWNTSDNTRGIFAIIPTTEAEAKGKFHSRITIDGGRIVRVERVDPAGKVQQTKTAKYGADGSWERTVVDDRGALVDTFRYTKDGIRTQVRRGGSPFTDGCARLKFSYTPEGNPIERACLDADGHVIIDAIGCQIRAVELNENRQTISQRCLMEGGKPVLSSDGNHLLRVVYDARGQVSELSMFAIDGSPASDRRGCARLRSEYDVAGNKIAERCIGSSGLPIARRGSAIAATRSSYDEHGCQVRLEYVDVEGKLALLGPVAATVYTRDGSCNALSIETLDAKGALVAGLGAEGVARFELEFDDKGNAVQQRCYDDKRKPASCTGNAESKDSLRRYAYDDEGRVISSKRLDGDGNPAKKTPFPHETRSRYDERGLLVEETSFDAEGKPAVALGNVSRRAFRYDALGSETSRAYYGADGAPVDSTTARVHEIRTAYDDKHRRTRVELRERDGSPATKASISHDGVVWPSRASSMEVIRDAGIRNRFLDKDGKEVSVVDCAKLETACYR